MTRRSAITKTLAQVDEARSNADRNARIPVEEHIQNHLSQANQLPGTSQKNSFVSLTKIDKLGINPGSSDNHTPLGIYAYPSEYVVRKLNGRKITALPHASFQPYTNIFSVQGNVVDLGTMSGGELEKYKAALKKMYVSVADGDPDAEDFLEELIVRRELSFNFVYYNQNYDRSLKDILYDWAYESLMEHKSDEREYLYDYQELENAETHDQYWNAAQREMQITGKMHNYMRMYWGKKILEWTSDPEEAYQWALKLNNKYSLDGRDPNSYAGVGWIFSKHDRAWTEREVFGKVRYMNAGGLERKFDMEKYLNKINNLK